jgi:hypothetical protein
MRIKGRSGRYLGVTHAPFVDRTVDLVGLSCSDFLTSARVAVAGSKPSAARQVEAKAARDDIAYGLIWLHGYQSGHGRGMAALKKAWLKDTTAHLVRTCRAAPNPSAVGLIDMVRQ